MRLRLVQVRDPLALHKKLAAEPVRFRDRQYSLDGRRRRRIYDVSTTSISNIIKAYSLSSNFHNDMFIHENHVMLETGLLKELVERRRLGLLSDDWPLCSVMFSHTQCAFILRTFALMPHRIPVGLYLFAADVA